MENKKFPSNKKLISIQEEKLIREVDYDITTGDSTSFPKQQLLLEILQKGPAYPEASQKIFVSIKPRAPPIKTLYIAEKNRFHSKRTSDKSRSRLAIGDHSSFATHFSGNNNIEHLITQNPRHQKAQSPPNFDAEIYLQNNSHLQNTITTSECSCNNNTSYRDVGENSRRQREVKKCYKPQEINLIMNNSKALPNTINATTCPKKIDIATLVVTNIPTKDSLPKFSGAINKLHRRIDHLERKILKQEMVFRSLDHNIPLSSSDEEINEQVMRSTSGAGRPGCSYIEQYSHIPETSAFQKYTHQGSAVSPSKVATLEKEHNSEQYGRDFTTYDGITARGRRQCASVPCKRDDIPKIAAERVQKIRHKLNPVRDYRLMDTVHYLAQGEFAPRDDGIKLTPSREAVLSDIIWEDVCRTHWPNTRLGRRTVHPERFSTRGELQRLIDNLLRERVAHVERRKRRHYRIVKLNNRHENCRTVGKTGDIIVASHKSKQDSNRNVIINDYKTTSAVMTDRRRREADSRKNHKSYERLIIPRIQTPAVSGNRQKNCHPGPSYAVYSPSNGVPTNCYHASTSNNQRQNTTSCSTTGSNKMPELTSGSSVSTFKPKKPRLVVKKEFPRRKNLSKEEPDLEHFILLPTLVIRTPSNMKRQKKFNELYHRILNVQRNEDQNNAADAATIPDAENYIRNKKDIGLNINITLSDSEEGITER